jgi:hypothetical protein
MLECKVRELRAYKVGYEKLRKVFGKDRRLEGRESKEM